jgi:hypothetical protein
MDPACLKGVPCRAENYRPTVFSQHDDRAAVAARPIGERREECDSILYCLSDQLGPLDVRHFVVGPTPLKDFVLVAVEAIRSRAPCAARYNVNSRQRNRRHIV